MFSLESILAQHRSSYQRERRIIELGNQYKVIIDFLSEEQQAEILGHFMNGTAGDLNWLTYWIKEKKGKK